MHSMPLNFLALFVLCCFVGFSYGLECNFGKNGFNQVYNTRSCPSGQNFCATIEEIDQANNVVDVTRDCVDSSTCTSNGCHDTGRNYASHYQRICCCNKNYCNGATTALTFGLPIAALTYYLYKSL
ncbi:unnamed protein product [Caenorhabditis auriculariae]|uniref:UPAR/Ly6 domain-containing protein n=1 Tax=Caenorhabditis auriculariae TaxID=2777116 RepID=A0A8S1GQN7_9PELO|nr:unnamed protein product [Caenorhabditis auriculariae]